MGSWTRAYPVSSLNWIRSVLLPLRRMKRGSGFFLGMGIKPSELNSLIRSFKTASEDRELILTSEDLDALDIVNSILTSSDYSEEPVTWKEYASLHSLSPTLPYEVWKDKILNAAREGK